MKNIKLYLSILAIVFMMNSCEKFVDIKKSSNQPLLETTDDCQLLLDNYTYMNTGYPNDGEASGDDYWLTDAGYLSGSLNQTDRDVYSWETFAIRPSAGPQWLNPYHTVFSANVVMESLDRIKKKGNADQNVINMQRGAALFYRCFAFWQVAQLYTKPYNPVTAGQDLGIPLRLSSDISDKSVRGTLSQTYERIIQDLKDATDLLPVTSAKPTRPNKAAAYALLARTYLSMQDYPNALINASASLDFYKELIDFNTLSKSSNTPFSPRFNKEVIFHAIMAVGTSAANNILNPANNSTGARIDMGLVASYQANDLRKQIFLKQNNTSIRVRKTPTSPDSVSVSVPDGTYRFTGNYEGSAAATLFVGLAVDEMYLIRAECYARTGNASAAMKDLNTLLSTRWVVGTWVNMTASTATDALALILAERRKELLMRGLRWTDDRRLNLTLNRQTKKIIGIASGSVSAGYTVGFTYPATATYTLPAGDKRFTLLIPQPVITDGEIEQNTR